MTDVHTLTERMVLGGFMLWKEKLGETKLEDRHFQDLQCRTAFKAIKKCFIEDGVLDYLTVKKKAGKDFRYSFLLDCSELVNHGGGLQKRFEDDVIDRYTVVQSNKLGKEMSSAEDSEQVGSMVSRAMKLISDREEENCENKLLSDHLVDLIEEEATGEQGIATGIASLDKMTKRFKKGHVWVVGGYTSTGKTWIAIRMAMYASVFCKVHFYSIEMTSRDIVGRIYHASQIQTRDRSRSQDFVKSMDEKIKIYDDKFSYEEISMHLMSQEQKPEVVFIDYIQNLDSDEREEYGKINKIMRQFQKLSKKLNCCIVLISQVNNEGASGASRKVMPFKGSGNIASTVDVGIVLERDDEEETDVVDVMMYVKKNRHGMVFQEPYKFNKRTAEITFRSHG